MRSRWDYPVPSALGVRTDPEVNRKNANQHDDDHEVPVNRARSEPCGMQVGDLVEVPGRTAHDCRIPGGRVTSPHADAWVHDGVEWLVKDVRGPRCLPWPTPTTSAARSGSAGYGS